MAVVVVSVRLLDMDIGTPSASRHVFKLRKQFILVISPVLRHKVIVAIRLVGRGRKRSSPEGVLSLKRLMRRNFRGRWKRIGRIAPELVLRRVAGVVRRRRGERRMGVLPGMKSILQLEEWHHPNVVEDDRPSGSETFRQLAQVLATGDAGLYQPSLPPNTHWRNWPDGGQL